MSVSVRKRLILCADDYGQSAAISEGILNCVARKRLSAVSCMVTLSRWPEDALRLLEYKNQIDIGLHLNFTEGLLHRMPAQSLFSWLCRSHFGWVNRRQVEAEITAQIDAFMQHMGAPPDFIDGHQHVHQLPVFRGCLWRVYQRFFKGKRPYLRVSLPVDTAQTSWFKRWVICLSGGLAFRRGCVARGIRFPEQFLGVYDFKADDYRRVFCAQLMALKQQGLMMCHPGLAGIENDALSRAREKEYHYLLSDDFTQDMQQAGCELSRFGGLQ